MPELPEIETIRRDLEESIIGTEISDVVVNLDRIVRGSTRIFKNNLKNKKIKKINRIGKLLMIVLDDAQTLLTHLKMTGQLIYQDKKSLISGGHSYGSDNNIYPNKYTYVILKFSNGSKLYFNDMRTFGYMEVVNPDRVYSIIQKYGIEPLQSEFTWANFKQIFQNRKTTLKAILLNQNLIVGIGNIYADEICFAAGVLPDRLANSLTKDELKLIFQASKKIIKKAIKYRGTTFNNYVDSRGKTGGFQQHLQVFHRDGEKCLRCKKGIIQKTRVAGRGTHFCPVCQK